MFRISDTPQRIRNTAIVDLDLYLLTLRKYWLIIVATALLAAAAALAYSSSQPRTYNATSALLISSSGSNSASGLHQGTLQARQELATLALFATRAETLTDVASELGVDTTLLELQAQILPDTAIIEVTATSTEPQLAAAWANGVAAKTAATTGEIFPAAKNVGLQATIIQPAVPPNAPAAPNTRRIVAVGFAAGVIIGVAIALYWARRRAQIRTGADITILTDLPVLAELNDHQLSNDTGFAADDDGLRRLTLAAMQLAESPQPPTAIVFSGANSSRAALLTAAAVARAAGEHLRVLVVEANFTEPLLASDLNLAVSGGLATVLRGETSWSNAVVKWPGTNVDVLAAPTFHPPNPVALASSPQMATVITEASQEYDLVLVAGLPTRSTGPAAPQLQIDSETIVVVESDVTSQEDLSRTVEQLNGAQRQITGIVIAGCRRSQSLARSMRPTAARQPLLGFLLPGFATDPMAQREFRRQVAKLTPAVALIAVVLIGLNIEIALGISTGTVAALVLLPVWLGTLSRFSWATAIVWTTILAVAFGWLLALFAAPDRGVSWSNAVSFSALVVTGVAALGVLLWSRTFLPTWVVALTFAVATLAGNLPAVPTTANPWKYLIIIPVATAVLAVLARKDAPVATTLWLLTLAGACVMVDLRSGMGVLLLATVVYLWARRPTRKERRVGILSSVAVLALLTIGLYTLGSTLLVSGFLGEELQQRSTAQIEEGGSLILGGRPEATATLALMASKPMGYGVGVQPSASDIWIAKEAMYTVGIESDNNYVDRYMFGGAFRLHSIIGEFWSNMGLAGVMAIGIVFAALVRCVVSTFASPRVPGLIPFVTLLALWYLLFGTVRSNWLEVLFALGIALPVIGNALPKPHGKPEPDSISNRAQSMTAKLASD